MKQETPPKHLDVEAFAQSAGAIGGRDLLSSYQRLMQETQGLGAENALSWSARGELRIDAAGVEQVWLHLTLEVMVPLTCQRCLRPVDIAVRENRSFRFVGNEEAAEAQDAEAEEDVLALSPDFSLAGLVEDEVLMALPLVPRHDPCPVEVKLTAVDPDFEAASLEQRQPFAVLAQLKNGKPH